MIPIRASLSAMLAIATFTVSVQAEEAKSYKIPVTPLLSSSETVIGQSIVYPKGKAKVTAVIVTVPPGRDVGWHSHAVPVFGYMLDGELTVDYGDKGTKVYKSGDALLEAMNWPHNGTNKGTVPVRILAVYMGAEGVPNTTPVAR